MKSFVAVTRLLQKKTNCLKETYYFHFKGVYEGRVIKGIIVEGQKYENLKTGEDYLLYLSFLSFEEGHIKAKILKVKPLLSLTC